MANNATRQNVPYELPGAYATTHRCAVPNCGARIQKEFLMCHRHWMDVPKATRDAVWSTWIRYRDGVNGEGREAYEAARKAAIGAVVSHRAAGFRTATQHRQVQS